MSASIEATVLRGWLPVILWGFASTVLADGGKPEPAPPPSGRTVAVESMSVKAPWGRIVLVGASASAGFTESEPLGGPKTPQYRLSRYVDAALLVKHEPVRSLANTMFFLQPEAAGRQQIDQALRLKPTLVVALDYLFWFCYGEGHTDAERLRRFDTGLKSLEGVRCPLILGDLPDVSGAVNGMLSEEQIPTAQAIAAANRRLKEWAAAQQQVKVLPLSRFMHTVVANQALTIHGHSLPEGKTSFLLQRDMLHPSPPGCAVLAVSILGAWQSTRPGLSAEDILWDPKEVFRRVMKSAPGADGAEAKPATATAPR